MATAQTLSHWFDQGVDLKFQHMALVVDDHSREDSPSYFDEIDGEIQSFIRDPGAGQRVSIVYDLTEDKRTQLRRSPAKPCSSCGVRRVQRLAGVRGIIHEGHHCATGGR